MKKLLFLLLTISSAFSKVNESLPNMPFVFQHEELTVDQFEAICLHYKRSRDWQTLFNYLSHILEITRNVELQGRALIYLGCLYQDGLGVATDLNEAQQLFRSGLAITQMPAQFKVIFQYRLAQVLFKMSRPIEAFEAWQETIQLLQSIVENEQADEVTQIKSKFLLAQMYVSGKGCRPNTQIARELYEACLNQQVSIKIQARSLYLLAKMLFEQSNSTEQEIQYAVQLFERVITNQHSSLSNRVWAHFYLGRMYRGEKGVPSDTVRAEQMFNEVLRLSQPTEEINSVTRFYIVQLLINEKRDSDRVRQLLNELLENNHAPDFIKDQVKCMKIMIDS